jgi:hypothetical protein
MIKLLQQFEQAIRKRNSALIKLLQPGLTEIEIRDRLKRADIRGSVETLVCMYSWKNGTRPTRGRTLEQLSPFPKSPFCFEDLELMVTHFQAFHEFAENNPAFAPAARNYFPMFWDSSSRWIAVALKQSLSSRVVLFDTESPKPVRELYKSFESFLKDAIRANKENDSLTCFQIQ